MRQASPPATAPDRLLSPGGRDTDYLLMVRGCWLPSSFLLSWDPPPDPKYGGAGHGRWVGALRYEGGLSPGPSRG